jgi:hypothetical protein
MGKRKRNGEWAVIFAEVPPALKAWLDAQAVANHRSSTAELIVILEGNLDPCHRPVAAAPKKPPGKPKRKK